MGIQKRNRICPESCSLSQMQERGCVSGSFIHHSCWRHSIAGTMPTPCSRAKLWAEEKRGVGRMAIDGNALKWAEVSLQQDCVHRRIFFSPPLSTGSEASVSFISCRRVTPHQSRKISREKVLDPSFSLFLLGSLADREVETPLVWTCELRKLTGFLFVCL